MAFGSEFCKYGIDHQFNDFFFIHDNLHFMGQIQITAKGAN